MKPVLVTKIKLNNEKMIDFFDINDHKESDLIHFTQDLSINSNINLYELGLTMERKDMALPKGLILALAEEIKKNE